MPWKKATRQDTFNLEVHDPKGRPRPGRLILIVALIFALLFGLRSQTEATGELQHWLTAIEDRLKAAYDTVAEMAGIGMGEIVEPVALPVESPESVLREGEDEAASCPPAFLRSEIRRIELFSIITETAPELSPSTVVMIASSQRRPFCSIVNDDLPWQRCIREQAGWQVIEGPDDTDWLPQQPLAGTLLETIYQDYVSRFGEQRARQIMAHTHIEWLYAGKGEFADRLVLMLQFVPPGWEYAVRHRHFLALDEQEQAALQTLSRPEQQGMVHLIAEGMDRMDERGRLQFRMGFMGLVDRGEDAAFAEVIHTVVSHPTLQRIAQEWGKAVERFVRTRMSETTEKAEAGKTNRK